MSLKNNKTRVKKLALILLSVSVLVAIILHSGITNLIIGIRKANLPLLLLVFLLLFVSNIFRALRWHTLLRGLGIESNFRELLNIFLGMFFLFQFSPQAGGDFYRAFALHKTIKQSFGLTSASVLYDRVLDLIVVLGLSATSLLLFWSYNSWGVNNMFYRYILILSLLSALLIVTVLVTLKPEVGQKLAYFVTRVSGVFSVKAANKIKEKFDKNLDQFYWTSNKLVRSKRTIYATSFFTLSAWVIGFFSSFVLFLAIGISLKFSTVAIIYFLPLIVVAVLSVFPKGATRNLSAYGICLLVGLSPEVGGLYVLLTRLLGLTFGITVGWLCFTQMSHKIPQ